MPTPSNGYVLFSSGLALPLAPVQLAWTLKERGFELQPDGDWLVVEPHQQLTDVDRAAIRKWKPHLMALLNYSWPETVQ